MNKFLLLFCFVVALIAFGVPATALAQDTLTVYANGPTLNEVILGDTTVSGAKLHHVYRLVSLDTTYLFDASITTNENITILGVPDPITKRPPCIQPDVLGNGQIPAIMFTLTGSKTHATFKNLYLLGLAINNSPDMGGTAIQVSADSVRVVVDNVVFEEWLAFAIGYNGVNDKFFITNSKFRNMVHPNQWYVGEVLRNEWPGAVPTDSVVMRYNTMLCVNGYASCPVSKAYVSYFDFSHNSVIYTFKNPFFIFNLTDAKINDNIFYGAWAGGIALPEYPWWDQLWTPEIGSIIDFDAMDSVKAAFILGHAATGFRDTTAEQMRKVEVKNNAYFWPAALTALWTAWNDTAHVDSVYTPTWMNARTTNMFTDKVTWPGFAESGNQNIDPGFGASIPGVLTQSTNGLLDWWVLCRSNTLTNTYWGYSKTQVTSAADWTPPWPLPEVADMSYSNVALKTGGTDGLPVGDPFWITGEPTGVGPNPGLTPKEFSLSVAYPNPFNPSTKIQYTLVKSGVVSLKVFDVLGRLVTMVVDNANQGAGTYTVSLDMSKYGSGVYIYTLQQGADKAVQKMMLMK